MTDDPDPSGAAAVYALGALLGAAAWLLYLTVSTMFERMPL
jgi:hypothetical protein